MDLSLPEPLASHFQGVFLLPNPSTSLSLVHLHAIGYTEWRDLVNYQGSLSLCVQEGKEKWVLVVDTSTACVVCKRAAVFSFLTEEPFPFSHWPSSLLEQPHSVLKWGLFSAEHRWVGFLLLHLPANCSMKSQAAFPIAEWPLTLGFSNSQLQARLGLWKIYQVYICIYKTGH